MEDERMEELVRELNGECAKRKRDRCIRTIQDITSELYSYRRHWIETNNPLAVDILEKYPSLKNREVVRFCTPIQSCFRYM